MNFKEIVLLVVGLTASSAALAAPVTVAEIDAARARGTLRQAWITGTSAPNNAIYEGWVGYGSGGSKRCDSGTNTIFSTQTGSAATPGSLGNFIAYACKRAEVVFVLYHTLDGGSLNAYTPHTVGTVLARVKFVGTGNGCTTSVNYVDPTNAENNATVFKGCAQVGIAVPATGATAASNSTNTTALAGDVNAPQLPVGGFSAVEASLFPASIGGGDVGSRGTESDVGAGQVFGVAVSIPLYRAMQTAQSLTLNDDPANAPNITSEQYTSLVAQGGAMNGDWTPLLGSNPGKVKLMRRVETSGSQTSSNVFFLQNPCAVGLSSSLFPSTNSDNVLGAYEVLLHSASGNVKLALTAASNNPAMIERYAIGVLSAENNWRVDPTTSNGYRYLKLDGVHPEAGDTENARVTATNTNYKFHMEMKNFVRANYAGKPAKTAFEASIIDSITNALKNPLATACSKFPRGLTLNPLNGPVCTVGAQVAKATNLGKNCAPAQVIQ